MKIIIQIVGFFISFLILLFLDDCVFAHISDALAITIVIAIIAIMISILYNVIEDLCE